MPDEEPAELQADVAPETEAEETQRPADAPKPGDELNEPMIDSLWSL